jgi:AcrR family transcriptional regulator
MHTQDRILHAARALFIQRGAKSVSMDDVARYLGMSKKTLYKWFRHKSELVYAALHDYLRELRSTLPAPHQHANALAEFVGLSAPQYARLHSSFFFDLQKYYPESWALWLDFKTSYLRQRLQNNLRRGIAEGLFQPEVDVDVLVSLRLAQLELAFDADVFPATCFPLQRVHTTCLQHFLAGIVTAHGRQHLPVAGLA